MREYHSVFIPLPHIYREGGLDVFRRLERSRIGDAKTDADGKNNLVVVPQSFVTQLNEQNLAEYSAGAKDVLQFLKRLDGARSEEGVVILSEGDLDIALVADDGRQSIAQLEEKVMASFRALKEERPIIISSDEVDHIRLKGSGLIVQDPQFLKVSADIVHEGIILGNPDLHAAVHQDGEGVPLESAVQMMGRDLFVNQFVKFRSADKESKHEYARVVANLKWNGSRTRIVDEIDPRVKLFSTHEYNRKIRIGDFTSEKVLGVAPRDMEQYIALQHGLFNPAVSVFFLCGSQGSGKTLLSYVAAIDQVLWYDKDSREERRWKDEGQYRQVVLLKPNEVLGGARRELGFLPGSLYEKLKPHIAPFVDAHKVTSLYREFPFEELLRHPRYDNDFGKARSEKMGAKKIGGVAHLPADNEVFEVTYSGFMRGRSFENTLLLVDEAQNFTPYELKTLIERLGEGSKAVVMGDPNQFDNPNCTREKNGLTHAIAHFLGRPYVMLVTLTRNYRSQASEDALSWRVYSS